MVCYILLIFKRVTVANLVDPLYWVGRVKHGEGILSLRGNRWFDCHKGLCSRSSWVSLYHLHKCEWSIQYVGGPSSHLYKLRQNILTMGDSYSFLASSFLLLFTYCSPRSLSTWAGNGVLMLNTTRQFELSERSCFPCMGAAKSLRSQNHFPIFFSDQTPDLKSAGSKYLYPSGHPWWSYSPVIVSANKGFWEIIILHGLQSLTGQWYTTQWYTYDITHEHLLIKKKN